MISKQVLANFYLETARLIIRPVKIEDELYYQKLYQNSEVMSSYAEGHPREQAIIKRTVEINVDRWERGKPFSCMTIELKESHEFIGSIYISTFARNDNTGILGYLLLPQYWGQGYASEAVKFLIEKYLPQINNGQYSEQITSVFAYANPANIASIRILKKMGFCEIGQMQKFGTERNEYQLSLDSI